MNNQILVLNAGSSTHKAQFFSKGISVWTGKLDWQKDYCLMTVYANDEKISRKLNHKDVEGALKLLLSTLTEGPTKVIDDPAKIDCIGHRVVQGGKYFKEPVIITPAVEKKIKELSPLAPLHNPVNLQGIKLAKKLLPGVPQVAVFDTAFYRQMPENTAQYAIPQLWRNWGIQRYGFHGISHQYCLHQAQKFLNKDTKNLRILSCHLGNGASLTAIHHNHPIDTTMGFTPLEGLMMGTRSGSIDPSIVIYLIKEKKLTPTQIDYALNSLSGLKGICGTSDMREVEAKANKGNIKALFALNLYVSRLKKCMGEMIMSLGGLDLLIFTGGIGENSAFIRKEACKALKFIGVSISSSKNDHLHPDCEISLAKSTAKVVILHTNEELAIAQFCDSKLRARSV